MNQKGFGIRKRGKDLNPKYSHPKISEILLKYASDYIGMGATLEEKRHYLDSAILAWNLSLLSEGEREKQMQASLKKLEALNPGSKNVEILKHNLAILVEKKLTEFPEIKKLILSAEISIVDGKECLYVASTDFQEAND
ncbi:MAG: hypothetical protein AB1649_22045 [Chloroflexota bacterium]